MYGLPDQAIGKINEVFARYPAIEKAILYGSRAKGTEKKGSDIDLTLMGTLSFQDLLHIETALDDLLLPWMIDLSIFADIENPALVDHINRVGCVLYQRAVDTRKAS